MSTLEEVLSCEDCLRVSICMPKVCLGSNGSIDLGFRRREFIYIQYLPHTHTSRYITFVLVYMCVLYSRESEGGGECGIYLSSKITLWREREREREVNKNPQSS